MNNAVQQSLLKVQKLYEAGQIEEAIKTCRQAMKRFSKKVEPCLLMANIAKQQGDIDTIVDALATACQRDPKNLTLKAQYADICIKAKKYDRAIKAYRSGLKLQPQEISWKIHLAAVLQKQPQHLDEAITLYRQVVKSKPNDANAQYNLGTALKQQHDYAGTLETYQNAAKLAPKDTNIAYSLCNLLIEMEAFEEAIEEINRLLSIDPNINMAWEWLWYACRKASRFNESLHAAQRLVEVGGDTANHLGILASAQISVKQYSEALQNCNISLEKNSSNRRALADKAIALSASNDIVSSQALFNIDEFLKVSTIAIPSGYQDVQAFNRDIIDHVQTPHHSF